MLERSWDRFSSMMAVHVPLPANIASTTLQRVSRKLTPQVSVEHLGISTKTVHPNYW